MDGRPVTHLKFGLQKINLWRQKWRLLSTTNLNHSKTFDLAMHARSQNSLMLIACDPPYQQCIWQFRVWKGILGIRDLTKIPCGIRENEKYLDGIRDLTATREAGFTKILGREAGFGCLSVGNLGNRHNPNKRYGGKSESTRRAHLSIERASFCRN